MRNDKLTAFRITGPGEFEHESIQQDDNSPKEAMKNPDMECVPHPLYYKFSDMDHPL